MKLLRYLAAIALAIGAASSAFAADPVFPPGARVGMTPLVGLNKAKTFPGFETEDQGVKVLIADLPAEAYGEVANAFKANPGGVSWGGGSAGGTDHILVGLIAKAAGVDPAKINYVPFKGGGEAIAAIVGGHVTAGVSGVGEFAEQIKGGRLRALAVTSLQRTALRPDLPTVAESGIPGFEVIVWYGVLGPAGMPRPVLMRVNQEVRKLSTLQEVKDRLASQGAEVITSTPEEFAARIRADRAKWEKIVKLSGAKPE